SLCELPSVDNLGDLRGQRQEPSKPRALGPRCAAGQAQPREPVHRAQQGSLCFQSRNSHARACVRSRGEGEMAIRPASNIEPIRSEEHTSELQSPYDLVCRLLLEKKNAPAITASRLHRRPIKHVRFTRQSAQCVKVSTSVENRW